MGPLDESFKTQPTIMDMHLHALDLGWVREMFAAYSWSRTPYTQEEYMVKNLEMLEQHDIRAVASGQLDIVKEWRKASPERIIPALLITRPSEIDIGSLRESILRGEIAVIGEVVTQYHGISPCDPLLESLWTLAEELDIPVGQHMGVGPSGPTYRGFPKWRARLCQPLILEDLLARHPTLRLYVMHAGWPMLDEMIHLLHLHLQVYVDVGCLGWAIGLEEYHFYLRRIVQAGYGKRVMFGSDQTVWPAFIEKSIEATRSADFLSEEQKQDIFYGNAARFLRLGSNKEER